MIPTHINKKKAVGTGIPEIYLIMPVMTQNTHTT